MLDLTEGVLREFVEAQHRAQPWRIDAELTRYRNGLALARVRESVDRLCDRWRRLKAPRWNPGKLEPSEASLSRRTK